MRTAHALAVTAALAAAVVAVPREAQAEEVTPTAKGIVGTEFLAAWAEKSKREQAAARAAMRWRE